MKKIEKFGVKTPEHNPYAIQNISNRPRLTVPKTQKPEHFLYENMEPSHSNQ